MATDNTITWLRKSFPLILFAITHQSVCHSRLVLLFGQKTLAWYESSRTLVVPGKAAEIVPSLAGAGATAPSGMLESASSNALSVMSATLLKVDAPKLAAEYKRDKT